MIRSDVEIIPMSTLLERCVENTEWFKRNFHVIAKEKKKRLIQITSLGGVKEDTLCCLWRWKTMVLCYNNQLKWKLKLTAFIPNVSSLSRNLLVHQGYFRCWRTRKAPSSASCTSPKPICQQLLQTPVKTCTSVIFCQHIIIPKTSPQNIH